jgi:hypothetical protein
MSVRANRKQFELSQLKGRIQKLIGNQIWQAITKERILH